MKQKDIKALFTKSRTELVKEVENKYKELTKVNMTLATKREKNVRKAQMIRDDIARMLTALRQVAQKEKKV